MLGSSRPTTGVIVIGTFLGKLTGLLRTGRAAIKHGAARSGPCCLLEARERLPSAKAIISLLSERDYCVCVTTAAAQSWLLRNLTKQRSNTSVGQKQVLVQRFCLE